MHQSTYWLYYVCRYVKRKSNCKNIELTFAMAECWREFHKVSQNTPLDFVLDREMVCIYVSANTVDQHSAYYYLLSQPAL